jgi:uncharacterized protein (DUF2237 family)
MDTTALAGLNPFGLFDVKAARLVVKSSTEWPEAIDAGFAHLVQLEARHRRTRTRLIGDRTWTSASPPRAARSGTAGPVSG